MYPNESLWLAGVEDGSHRQSHALDRRYDVVVVGAGISGLTTARLLVDQGMSVCVIEGRSIGRGATGYSTAKISALQQTRLSEIRSKLGDERTAVYADANLAAVERIARFVEDDAIDCAFTRASACTYALDDDGVRALDEEAEAAQMVGMGLLRYRGTELPFEVHDALWLENQAHFDPYRYLDGLARAIRNAGGVIVENTRVLDLDESATECEVSTEHGAVVSDHIVVSSHMPFTDKGMYFARTAPYRSYAMAVRVEGKPIEGMYINAGEPTGSVRSTTDGWVLVGGEGHKVGQEPDTSRRYAALERWTRDNFAVTEVGPQWSTQDNLTVDYMPYVGQLSANEERTWVATGYGKWGMTNGTVAAMILSERIAGRDHAWQEAFDSTRRKPVASLAKTVSENLNVAKHLVGDRLTKDGPTCTHLGCRTTFNTAEGTWDCPCHGSRFDETGHVLEGPATRPIDVTGHEAHSTPRAS